VYVPRDGESSGMHVAKVVEITSASTKSFEDAISLGIARASKTLEGIQRPWVKEQKVVVKDGKIAEFRVDIRVTFLPHFQQILGRSNLRLDLLPRGKTGRRSLPPCRRDTGTAP